MASGRKVVRITCTSQVTENKAVSPSLSYHVHDNSLSSRRNKGIMFRMPAHCNACSWPARTEQFWQSDSPRLCGRMRPVQHPPATMLLNMTHASHAKDRLAKEEVFNETQRNPCRYHARALR
eukprot:1431950-Amphidinium_carterae.2